MEASSSDVVLKYKVIAGILFKYSSDICLVLFHSLSTFYSNTVQACSFVCCLFMFV